MSYFKTIAKQAVKLCAGNSAAFHGSATVIEIVETEDKIKSMLPFLDEMMGGGLVTLEKIKVIHYREGKESR